ncbi:MAG: GNAT family protein [Chloroflexota bacterium]
MTDNRPPRVRLRDITLQDADLLDAWDGATHTSGGFNDFDVPHEPLSRESLALGPLRDEHNGRFIVERIADDTPIGAVGWHEVRFGPNTPSTAWNFGIELIPDARGQGYGTEAQRLLAAWLFEWTTFNRIEASTDVTNLAEQRSLEKAGFTREGVVRGAQFRAGAYHDLVVYSRLRDDPD